MTGFRKEVADFAWQMEAKLRKNDHKTHWRELPVEALRRLMMIEIEEFNVAREFFGPEEAANELIDISNYAMMLRDRILHVTVKPNTSPCSCPDGEAPPLCYHKHALSECLAAHEANMNGTYDEQLVSPGTSNGVGNPTMVHRQDTEPG